MFNNKNYAIMQNEFYLIEYYKKPNFKYAGTIRLIFKEEKDAKKYIENCDRKKYAFMIYKEYAI